MADLNNKILAEAGTVFVSSDYDQASTVIDAITDGNFSAVKAQLDALSYDELGEFQAFQDEITLDDEQETKSAKCGSGVIAVNITKSATVRRDWLELDDIDSLVKFLGLKTSTTTSGATAVTDRVINFADADAGVEIPENADGTKMTITTVNDALLAAGTPSIEGTDYEIKKVNGTWYIFIIDGGNMAISTNYYLTGSYTTIQQKTLGFNFGKDSIPMSLIKFVSCDQELTEAEKVTYAPATAVRRTIYYVKMTPTSSVVRAHQDLDISELAAQTIEFNGRDGGLMVEYKDFITV